MPTRFLVVAPQGLGDSLEATPLVHALRLSQPAAVIDVVVTRPQAAQLFAGMPDLVNEVIYLPYWEKGRAAFVTSLLRARWRPRYDASFLCYPAARREYQVLLFAFPAKRRYTHAYSGRSLSSLEWLQSRAIRVEPKHNVLRNMDLLVAAGIEFATPLSYTVPSNWISMNGRNGRQVALHVGSIAHDGLEQRRWPLENFVEVARGLCDAGYTVRAVMGPSEVAETERLRALEPRVGVIQGPLEDVARELSESALTIANDNGIAHLSAGVRTHTISLFGPTPLFHAPFGPESHPLRPSICPPCFDVRLLNTDCALNIGFACIRQELTVEAVLQSALELLSASTTPNASMLAETRTAINRSTPG